CQHFWATPYTF
nr:immunoglobulin light chain junction region [Mus musculus]NSM02637.1 immunoglobulin light chain junction region [Mus musculus]NSM03051.1 immunoglobulin light chain junction region [Mus musculus]